jgi:hypothetical protein
MYDRTAAVSGRGYTISISAHGKPNAALKGRIDDRNPAFVCSSIALAIDWGRPWKTMADRELQMTRGGE